MSVEGFGGEWSVVKHYIPENIKIMDEENREWLENIVPSLREGFPDIFSDKVFVQMIGILGRKEGREYVQVFGEKLPHNERIYLVQDNGIIVEFLETGGTLPLHKGFGLRPSGRLFDSRYESYGSGSERREYKTVEVD